MRSVLLSILVSLAMVVYGAPDPVHVLVPVQSGVGGGQSGTGGGGQPQAASGAPTGTCFTAGLYVDTATANFYDCLAGTWTLVGSAAGGGGFTGGNVPNATTFQASAALSASAVSLTGQPITGGTGTTTFPLFGLLSGGTAVTAWNTNGTMIGVNAPSGFTGDLINLFVNNSGPKFRVDTNGLVTAGTINSSGTVSAAAGSALCMTSNSCLRSAANGRASINTNANGANGQTRITFGTEATNNPAFAFDGSTATFKTADGAGTTANGIFSSAQYLSDTNCASSGGTCSAAVAGRVSIAAAATTVTVATTKVTANSEIFVQEDTTLGTALSVTCNTTTGRIYTVTARTGGTSFQITASAAPTTNPACLNYHIIN